MALEWGSPSSAGARADTAFGAFWTGGQTLFDANQVPGRRTDPSEQEERSSSKRKEGRRVFVMAK